MTTTLIYEPMASISDDYFQLPKAGGSASSRDNVDDRSAIEPALNIGEGHVPSRAAMLATESDRLEPAQ